MNNGSFLWINHRAIKSEFNLAVSIASDQLTPSSPSSLKHSNLLCWVFHKPKAGLQKDCLWMLMEGRYDNISYIKYYLTKADAIRT